MARVVLSSGEVPAQYTRALHGPRIHDRRSSSASASPVMGRRSSSLVPMSRKVTCPAEISSGPTTTTKRAPSLFACLNWDLSERA